MFSSLFERPKMSEKLLSKPPFKYIFDIVFETSKVKQQQNYEEIFIIYLSAAPKYYCNLTLIVFFKIILP